MIRRCFEWVAVGANRLHQLRSFGDEDAGRRGDTVRRQAADDVVVGRAELELLVRRVSSHPRCSYYRRRWRIFGPLRCLRLRTLHVGKEYQRLRIHSRLRRYKCPYQLYFRFEDDFCLILLPVYASSNNSRRKAWCFWVVRPSVSCPTP